MLIKLLECFQATVYLERDTAEWRLPKEDQQLRDFIDDMNDLSYYASICGTDALAELLKEESIACRRAWITGNRYSGLIRSVHKEEYWGYLGRSLPCKPERLVEEDRKRTETGFLQGSSLKGNKTIIELTKNVVSKWVTRTDGHMAVETPPYSESASLITPRSIGGQAGFFRDLVNLLHSIALKKNPEGKPSAAIEGGELMDGYLTEDDKNIIMFIHDCNVFDPNERSRQYSTIADILFFLDYPFLKHLRTCNNPDCHHPELHYPFYVAGIPETGWRSRCASLPWPSLCYMCEIPRRCIMRGAKHDPVTKQALSDFKELPSVCNYDYINSTDLQTATDNFPLHLQEEVAWRMASTWRGTTYEDFIVSSFRTNRIVEENCFDQWPGLDYFLGMTDQNIFNLDTFGMEQTMKNPLIRKMRDRLADYCNKYTLSGGVGSFTTKYIPAAAEKIDSNETIFVRPKLERDRYLSYFVRSELDSRTTKRGMFIGTKHKNSRLFGQNESPLWLGCQTDSNVMDPITREFSYCEHDRIISNRQKTRTQMNKIHNKSLDELLYVFAKIRDWYRRNFTSAPGKLSRKGQHMSLPLSWVSLAALNTASALKSKRHDPTAKIFTMGDDCVYATNNKNDIIDYQKNLLSVGCIINSKKDMTSQCGRAVFCEYLVDRGQWIDIPRAKLITQPALDTKGIQWLSMRERINKYFPDSTKTVIRELQIAKHRATLERAMKHGFSPSLPTELGGMGIPIPGRFDEFYNIQISNTNLDPESVLTMDRHAQRIAGINPRYTQATFLWSMLDDKEYYLSNKKREQYTIEEAQELLICNIVPSIIYLPSFEREDFERKTPEDVGENMWRMYSSLGFLGRGIVTTDQVVNFRLSIRVRSQFLDLLKEKQLDTLEFWKFSKL